MSGPRWRAQLSHVALGCADVSRAAHFYAEVLGLQEHSRSADGGQRRLGWSSGQHVLDLVRDADDLDHFALEIPDRGELKEMIASVRSAGSEVVRAGDEEGGEGFSLHDPEGRRIELHGRVDRSAEHCADPARRPVRLQHITLATRRLEELVAFYVDVLGFSISDRMGDVFVWLRCGVEHHTVALVAAPGEALLDHFSFDLGGWADFKVWCDRLAALGVLVSWGPGRHGPGNNLFIMFDDPDGRHIELSSEMELFYDDRADYEPRIWKAEPRTVNLWGPAPVWRRPQVSA